MNIYLHWNDSGNGLHWATVYFAREHRKLDIEEYGHWNCICRMCAAVRANLPVKRKVRK